MKLRLFSLLAYLVCIGEAQAALRDAAIDNAQLCTRHFPGLERQHAIPDNLLAAIASTESGRWHDKLKIKLPWPWTINVEGKGYYFDSKNEALAKVRAFQRQGKKSIDIGCMQVNLKHHPDAFPSLEAAFDPAHNTAYAAKFLRSNYEESRSWLTAAATYHSRTPSKGRRYLGLIEKSWSAISDRVQHAARQTGGQKVVKVTAPSELTQLQKAIARDALSVASPRTASRKAKHTSPSLRVIQVSDSEDVENARRKSVMLISANTRRTASQAEEDSPRVSSKVKNLLVADKDLQQTKGVSIKVDDRDNGTSVRSNRVGNSPVFIFSN